MGGGPEIDWTNVDGVDVKLAAEFNALGIKNFNQLNSLTNEQRDNLNSHLKSKGLSWNWSSAPNWEKTAQSTAASLGGVAKSAASADPKPKWNKEDFQHTSIPAPEANAVTKHLSQFENTNRTSRTPEQSDRPTDSTTKRNQTSSASLKQTDADGLKPVKGFAAGVGSSQSGSSQSGSSQSSTSQTSTSQSSTSQSETAQTGISSLGISLPQSEGPSLNWTTLRGVGGGTGNELNRLGIKNFEQLQSLSLMDRQKLGDHMRSKGLHWDWSSLMDLADGGDSTFSPPQAEVKPHSSTEAASSAGASIFAKGAIKKPEFKDDLTLLDGIEGPQAAALQKMGIFNFTQLHNLSLEDRAELQNSFRHRGWNLDMDQWRIASEGNTEHPTIEEIQRKAFEIYQDRDRKGFGGGERTDWEQAEWELRGNPIFSYGVPHDIDDFAVNLTGVTAEARDELYRMGLYNRGQLSELGHDARRLLTRWFAGPRFGVDLTQSFGWLSTMNSVPEDKDFGKVFAIRPTRVDDLSDINGVGGPTEHDLNRIGIYQFEQIANWTDDNIAAVDELLELDGRIQRDQWVVQARRIVDQNQ